MPHVTFIHGIANKPPADDLLRIWGDALADAADPLPLGDLGVTSSMVYWADLMYEKPDEDLAAYEGVLENTAEAVDGGGGAAPPGAANGRGGGVSRRPAGEDDGLIRRGDGRRRAATGRRRTRRCRWSACRCRGSSRSAS